MTTIAPTATLAVVEPAFSEAGKLALGGFLAGYSGPTRARPDLAPGSERAAGLRGHRGRYRSPGNRARPPDPDDHPQGRQESAAPEIAR
jgi:hypothetical protein